MRIEIILCIHYDQLKIKIFNYILCVHLCSSWHAVSLATYGVRLVFFQRLWSLRSVMPFMSEVHHFIVLHLRHFWNPNSSKWHNWMSCQASFFPLYCFRWRRSIFSTLLAHNKHCQRSQRRLTGFSWVLFTFTVQKPCHTVTRLVKPHMKVTRTTSTNDLFECNPEMAEDMGLVQGVVLCGFCSFPRSCTLFWNFE